MQQSINLKDFEIKEIEEEFTLISELYKEISEMVSTQGKDISTIEENISKLELDTEEIEKEIFESKEIQKENLFEFSRDILLGSGIGGITLGAIYLFSSPTNILAGMIGGMMIGGLSGFILKK